MASKSTPAMSRWRLSGCRCSASSRRGRSKMRRLPRNSDGTIRRTDRPRRLTNRSLIARWVEAETLHLKRLGMGLQAIAEHLIGVAQGQRKALVPVPEQVQFPEAYRISLQAVHLA